MSGDVDALVVWLRAQLDEDERIAQEANHGGRWSYSDGDSVAAWGLYDEHWRIADMATYDREGYNYAERMPAVRAPGYVDPDANGRHIARWDPARVLAEVAAKRGIMRHHGPGHSCDDLVWAEPPCSTLRHLAAPYADRPGYRQEWGPDV